MSRRKQGGGSPQLYYHDCSGRIQGHTTRILYLGKDLVVCGGQGWDGAGRETWGPGRDLGGKQGWAISVGERAGEVHACKLIRS